MRKVCLSGILLLSVILLAGAASAATVGGDQGWYNVHCNVDGAAVYMDGNYMGEIVNGILTVPVYSTGTPYKTVSVEMPGYTTWTENIDTNPAAGEQEDIYATLNPVPTPEPIMIGGDTGYYVVYCNVDGADVYFGSDYKGQTANGELTVEVYTTGTPYTTYSVQKSGYTPFTAQITEYPEKGDTVKLHATLNPAPAPEPTKSPVAPGIILFSVMAALLCGFLISRRE
ncbi:PEGA domain-containing protein [Methanoplanus limicola]|uniref:PEGA domain protein n=1 Tax=Methanoplanus limicola DSM 2279 TaxID=937775 RepID=H1Z402_9EURY|nr:PEGA domain-containing protein [Methanoplanus limicola]EHQ36624.1 PEGA domain protein [Methanoplanus limicola DSM 2279]